MELWGEMLIAILAKETVRIEFPQLQEALPSIIESNCYQALCRIREILRDDSLEDAECFQKIEEIVCVLEELGSDGGSRHDF